MTHAALAVMFAMTVLMSDAFAATSACPPVGSIKQVPMAKGGYSYETTQPNGPIWSGENPSALPSYLDDVRFHDARYDAHSKAVTCTYKGPMNNEASISVTLKPVLGWNLIPIAHWRGTYCEALDISECSFTHQ